MKPLPNPQRQRSICIAHLTDVHVQPEQSAPEGMAKALRHAQSSSDKPEIIFNGGDAIMDALGADKARTECNGKSGKAYRKTNVRCPSCIAPAITTFGAGTRKHQPANMTSFTASNG